MFECSTALPALTRVQLKGLFDASQISGLFMMLRFFLNPSPNQPFIFDIDGRTLEFGKEDFYLITGFRFGKVEIDPKEEDHYEFRKRVFPGVPNLKGEHLLKLIKKDVKFNKLDDEDAIRVCLLLALDCVSMGQELRHVITNAIVNLVDDFYKWEAFPWGKYMWSLFHERVYNVAVDRRKFHLDKLASNPKYEANYVLYGFVFPLKIWALETFSNSLHWWRKSENVIPRGLLIKKRYMFELLIKKTCVLELEDIQERAKLLKTIKEQEQMIVDLQRRLLSVEEITKQLKPGPSNVDHLDQTGNRSENVPVCGLDQQSMEGVSQCMNVDEPYKNEEARDDPEFKVRESEKASHSDDLEFKVKEMKKLLILVVFYLHNKLEESERRKYESVEREKRVFDTSSLGRISVQDDACVSELMDADQPSLVKNDLDDVHIDSVVKDAEESEYPRQKFPDLTRSPTAPKRTVSVPKADMALFRDKNRMEMCWTFPWLDDGHLVHIEFWEKLVGRNDAKRGWLSSDLWQFRDPNADWAMASRYLCDMLSRFEYPLYYIDDVYFPINEKDSHWVLGELHIISGLITIYDSLGGPPNGKGTRHFLLQLREKLMLSHNIPLEVDDPISFALAYRERMIEFYWKYKMLQ
ncbi:phospholipase-like protein [Tanacetum coccineum]|uniref:Phospholipase-like protein n=1 Tax=Tanacetum coccineum TaxID=301880 RepID=A0ABQ5HZ68_9ASTR